LDVSNCFLGLDSRIEHFLFYNNIFKKGIEMKKSKLQFKIKNLLFIKIILHFALSFCILNFTICI